MAIQSLVRPLLQAQHYVLQLPEIGSAEASHCHGRSLVNASDSKEFAPLTWIPSFRRLSQKMGQILFIGRLHLGLTLKPGVPQPGLFPSVISLKVDFPSEYSSGFKNPRGGFLADNRAELSKPTMPANDGDDAEVPPIETARPRKNILKLSACADTSGIACNFFGKLTDEILLIAHTRPFL